MKVGFVLDDTLDSTDGVQQYVLLLGKWLSSKQHEVHYLVGASSRQDLANIHSISRNIKVRFNKNKMTIPLPTSDKKIRSLLVKEQFDILHVQMPFSPMLAGKIIKHADEKTGLVATFHIAPYGNIVRIATKVLGQSQKNTIKKIDKIMSVSTVARDFAKDSFQIDSLVVPNAIDLGQWHPNKTQIKQYDIAFVGRLVERKGCIHLLKSINLLKKQNNLSPKKVIIVGDGPQKQMLLDYIKQNNLDNLCEFTGFVTDKVKVKILQSSKIAIFPATGGESFGIVLLEAMAAGSVVLAGNNPGYTSVLGNKNPTLFNPKNQTELAGLISTLLSDQKLYDKINLEQKKLVQKYDINQVGSDILKVYNSVLKGKSNGS